MPTSIPGMDPDRVRICRNPPAHPSNPRRWVVEDEGMAVVGGDDQAQNTRCQGITGGKLELTPSFPSGGKLELTPSFPSGVRLGRVRGDVVDYRLKGEPVL